MEVKKEEAVRELAPRIRGPNRTQGQRRHRVPVKAHRVHPAHTERQ
jgi:hypothetical protein